MYTEQEVFEKWFPSWFHMQCKMKGVELFCAGLSCHRVRALIELKLWYGFSLTGEWEDYCDMYLGIPHDDEEALHTLFRSVVRSAGLKEVQEGNTTYYKHYGT